MLFVYVYDNKFIYTYIYYNNDTCHIRFLVYKEYCGQEINWYEMVEWRRIGFKLIMVF